MNILPSSENGIQEALKTLRTGGVVAHATETCYGLACDLQNPEAVDRLFAMKHRPQDMPVSALFASVDQAKHYLEWNEEAAQLASQHLPGPLTIILPLKHSPRSMIYVTPVTNNQSLITIGLRISSHPTARRVIESFGSPLSTTSANIHGMPNPYSIEEITMQFERAGHKPDLILDDGELERIDASTVVDVSDGVLHVLRSGELSL